MYASIMENTIMAFLEDKNVLGESQRVPLEKTDVPRTTYSH
jgi:hypothetical protein